jgi:thiamine-monophosphate kinase
VVEYERIPRDSAFRKVANADLEAQCVLSGGDDYELLFAARQDERARIETLSDELGLALSRIGAITTGAALTILDKNGSPMPYKGGYDHFGPT